MGHLGDRRRDEWVGEKRRWGGEKGGEERRKRNGGGEEEPESEGVGEEAD